eukprot:5877948-Lingulodinium_polyedra.AAC.1
MSWCKAWACRAPRVALRPQRLMQQRSSRSTARRLRRRAPCAYPTTWRLRGRAGGIAGNSSG